MRDKKPSSVMSSCIRRQHSYVQVSVDVSYKLVFAANDVGDIHVVGRWGKIFQLLAGEDVDGDQVDLSVTVLASLGRGHVDDFAWATFDDDVTVLSQGGTLHREGGRGAGIGGLESVLMLDTVYVSISSQIQIRYEVDHSTRLNAPSLEAIQRGFCRPAYLGIIVLRHVEVGSKGKLERETASSMG
jgi:hypothetical protein